MLTLRRILFILFVLIYLICCPLIILYALGINLSPRSDQNLVKTGIISLSSLPPGATVYLNQLRYPEKTATVIRSLTPQLYSIKLVLNNYWPWEKIVPVKAEKASVLEHVLLIPLSWKTEPVSSLPSEEIIPLNHNSLFLVKNGPLVQDLFLFRITDNMSGPIRLEPQSIDKKTALTPLFPEDTIYNQAKIISWFTIPESPFILLYLTLNGDSKFLWVDLRQKLPPIDDITDLFAKKPRNVSWENLDNKNIFIYQDHALTRLETTTKAIYPNVAQNIRGWGISNQRIYTFSNDLIVKKSNFEGKDEQFIFQDRTFVLAHFGKETEYKIFIVAEDIILFLGQDGELLCNQSPFKLIDKKVKNFIFDEESKRLLVWTDHDLGIIDFSLPDQNHLLAPGPVITWLTKSADNIEQAFWANQSAHVILRDHNKVILMETEKFNDPAAYEVINVKKNSSVVYSETSGKLYYLDEQTQRLSVLTIIPGKDAFTFTNRRSKRQDEGSL